MEKVGRETFDESITSHQIRQNLPMFKFCAIWHSSTGIQSYC